MLACALAPEGDVVPSGIWKVFVHTDDATASYARAVEAGAAPIAPPKRLEQFGVTIALVKDPDGPLIELGQLDV
jgi:predicted enzyme related to lactoylglutathione lyase